jgi:hypothetical protein
MALTYRTGKQARWFNGDSLTVFFPGSARTEVRGGHLSLGGENCTELFVTLSELPVLSGDSNGLLLADTVVLPGGAFITKLETLVTTETAGVNANLNLGIVNAVTMAITDADYLLAAADIFNGGTDVGLETVFRKGDTEAGAGVGAQLSLDSYICGAYDTGAFTTGVLRVRVFWSMVLAADD